MVTAGTIKANVRGSRSKKFRRLAWLKRKKVEKKNHPVMTRKIDMTI
jgi:hypothetical protein